MSFPGMGSQSGCGGKTPRPPLFMGRDCILKRDCVRSTFTREHLPPSWLEPYWVSTERQVGQVICDGELKDWREILILTYKSMFSYLDIRFLKEVSDASTLWKKVSARRPRRTTPLLGSRKRKCSHVCRYKWFHFLDKTMDGCIACTRLDKLTS